jgi:beta-N-acetylhexosaminidase
LVQAVQQDQVLQQQLDASVRRIINAKEKFGILIPTLIMDSAKAGVATATVEHHALALELARKAITLLKDTSSLLPLRSGESLLVIETTAARGLGKLLGARTLEIKLDPDPSTITTALNIARAVHSIIITTTDASFHRGQVQLVNELLANNLNIIIISVRTPYDISLFRTVPTVLAAYGGNPPTLQAIHDVLMGNSEASGVLPVTLP